MVNALKPARANVGIADEDVLRANVYGLLARALFQIPSDQQLSEWAGLSGDDSELGSAFNSLARLARATDLASARDEYNALFVGMTRGELLPFASYYLTGFLHEKPLAKVRASMRELGIERRADNREPEDHLGSLLEMMSGLILGTYGAPLDLTEQHAFLETHIVSWAGHFFRDLEAARSSRLYQPIGTIGRLFLAIEEQAFAME